MPVFLWDVSQYQPAGSLEAVSMVRFALRQAAHVALAAAVSDEAAEGGVAGAPLGEVVAP